MKPSSPGLIALLLIYLLSACNQPAAKKTKSATEVMPSALDKSVDTSKISTKTKVKFVDTLVMTVTDEDHIKFLDIDYSIGADERPFNTLISNYLSACYTDYKKLPVQIVIKYASARAKSIFKKNVEETVVAALQQTERDFRGSYIRPSQFAVIYQRQF